MITSALLYGRNDGYKENERIVVCLESMLETFDEVMFLDWNSPQGKNPLLWDLYEQLPKTKRLKHFVIPPTVVSELTSGNENVQVCIHSWSHNIMLKRTSADWVAATTIDIIAPKKETFNAFLQKANKNTFYTLSRRDVDISLLYNYGFNKWRDVRDELDETSAERRFYAKVTPNDSYSIINCCGDFQLAHKDLWNSIKGFEEQMVYACFQDTNVQKKAVLNGFNLEAIYDIPFYHLSHKGMGNDGSSPSKQVYNDAFEWVEWFDKSQNQDTWGFSETEIEYEVI